MVLTAAVAIGLSLEVVGKSIAANSMWATPYGDEEAGVIGPLKDGLELGHTMASSGDAVAVISAVVLADTPSLLSNGTPSSSGFGHGLMFHPASLDCSVIGCTFVLTYYLAFFSEASDRLGASCDIYLTAPPQRSI